MLLKWKLQSCPFGSKVPTITHLKQVKKVTGKTPSQLEAYENSSIPESLKYIYRLFLDFYNGDRFTHSEFNAWLSYIDVELDYREKELIRQLHLEKDAFDFKRQQEYSEYLRMQQERKSKLR